jgi:CheY-like chemotaxis protein
MALRLVHDRTPDLIVLDLMMPVMNGWDFYAEIQRTPSYVRIPVAILSGVARMRPFGTMHELHKPLDLPSLLGLLHAVAAPEESRRAVRVRPS